MKYIKEILLAVIAIVLILHYVTYRQKVASERFRVIGDKQMLNSLFDTKTNKTYINLPDPDDDHQLKYYEESDFYKNKFKAKSYTPEELKKQ